MGNWWLSGLCVDMVIPMTLFWAPHPVTDNFQPFLNGGRLSMCCRIINKLIPQWLSQVEHLGCSVDQESHSETPKGGLVWENWKSQLSEVWNPAPMVFITAPHITHHSCHFVWFCFHSSFVVRCFMALLHSVMSSAQCSSNPINARSSFIHLHIFLGLPTGLLPSTANLSKTPNTTSSFAPSICLEHQSSFLSEQWCRFLIMTGVTVLDNMASEASTKFFFFSVNFI